MSRSGVRRGRGAGRSAALLPRPAELLRRPTEFVARIRWLFALSALAALVLTPIGVLVVGNAWSLGLVAGSAVALAGSWLHRYRGRRALASLDVVDAVAVLLFALACPQPAVAFGLVVPAMWFRSAYGSNRRMAAYSVAVCAAIALAVPLWGVVPGQASWTAAAPVLGSLPVVVINAVVARHLSLSLLQRERDLDRDAALATLGGRLIGVTDRRQVIVESWVTADAICAATPGLRAVVVYEEPDGLRVSGTAGPFTSQLTLLPSDLLPVADGGRAVEFAAPPTLVESSGIRSQWVCFPLPDTPGGHMLLGAAPRVPQDGIVATRSMLNLVALALSTSTAHQELRTRALTDGLTGLANRSAFSAAMTQALRSPETRSWVLFLDLDDFKVVNDSLGHLAGDRLLAHLGDQLTATLRAGDLCARVGGDEFAVLLRDATESDARRIGHRLVQLISTPVQLPEGVARIGASIGVTEVSPGSAETLVVHQADVAMYAAKAAGKNRVQFFSPGLLGPGEREATEAERRTTHGELTPA